MSSGPIHVAVLTSVHPHDDVRIFHKEALSLAQAGYRVTLLNSEFSGEKQGVRFVRVSVRPGRMGRIASSWRRYADAALEQHPDICHLHDPELLPAIFRLKRHGVLTVYDAHEDLPLQIRGKPWIPSPIRPGLAWGAGTALVRMVHSCDLVFCATELIAGRFSGNTNSVIPLHNYPTLAEFPPIPFTPKERAVCYAGALSPDRGLFQMIGAARVAKAPLYLAGRFETPAHEADIRRMPGVAYLGVLGRKELACLYGRCAAGLAVLHPTPAYREALPIKLLEYLAAGLPVIASDFPGWRALLAGADCARFVDPLDETALTSAIRELTGDFSLSSALGKQGRALIEERYCWEREQEQLLRGYRELLQNKQSGR